MVKLLKNATPTVVVVVGNMQQKQNLVILENIERVFQYFFVGVPYSWETGLYLDSPLKVVPALRENSWCKLRTWIVTHDWNSKITPLKINIEPENDGFGSDVFPFQKGDFQLQNANFPGIIASSHGYQLYPWPTLREPPNNSMSLESEAEKPCARWGMPCLACTLPWN